MTDSAANAQPSKETFMQKLFKEFDWTKFASAVMLAAGAGAAYSVLDQTVIHRPQAGSKLPCVNDYLQTYAADILEALDRFYQYRNVVPDRRSKNEFYRLTGEVVHQSEFIASIYQHFMGKREKITPDMKSFDLINRMRAHIKIAVECMRTMRALVNRPGDVDFEDAFNTLYSTYHNRIYVLEQQVKK
jgi:hypothetical protein